MDHFKKHIMNRMFKIVVLIIISVQSIFAFPTRNSKTAVNPADYSHPRLFFSLDDLDRLRQNAGTTHAEIWAPIAYYLDARQDEYLPPDSAPAEGSQTAYRNFANRLIPFAFGSQVTMDTTQISYAISYMLTLSHWTQWGAAEQRDLGLAHMLIANSLSYDWLFNDFNDQERNAIRTSLGDWAEKMYEASTGQKVDAWRNWWRKSYMQNHHWTNNSALGMAALALLGEDNRAQKWLDHAVNELTKVRFLLEGIEDGSWHEGLHYQAYGLTTMLTFLKCLKDVQQIDLLPAKYLRNYVKWRIYNYLPGSNEFLFLASSFDKEWGVAYAPQNILRFIAGEFQNQHAEWMAQKFIEINGRGYNQWSVPWYVFEFLYYDPMITAQPPEKLSTAAVFPDYSGVVWRSDWTEDAVIFGFKCGTQGGRYAFDSYVNGTYPWEPPYPETQCQLNIGHDHDDTNGFYIYGNRNWLSCETEGYGASQTSLHNTILIDGQGQFRPQESYRDVTEFENNDGTLRDYFSSRNYNFVSAQAVGRYKNIAGLQSVQRDVLFVRPDYFLMIDNLQADMPHTYEWISHFVSDVQVEGNWIKGLAENDQVLGVGILSPGDFSVSTGNDGKPYARINATTSQPDM
ncbi:MAG: DUF4962 domain-containing protein, partial [Deferribacteres bacterium]|nr:DUF4962 domain-containing protein [Deferribacteres bacterium]